MPTMKRLWFREDGQDLIEYSLLMVMIALAALLIMQHTGAAVTPVWTTGQSTIQNAATQTS